MVSVRRGGLLLLLVALLLGIAAATLWWRRPETTAALRGRRIARELGCFGCHGPGGRGGVADPTSPSGEVPDWSHTTFGQYVSSEQDIREWILYGAPRDQDWRRAYEDRPRLIPMPAYEDDLSPRQLDDLVAYCLAVSGWRPEYTEEAYQGRAIAIDRGCFGCHGPSGMGGVANPRSLKGHIPPWDGEEFAELVRDDDELREWILFGRIERLWQNPAARLFLERQKTPMPAYHDHLSDGELEKLVLYIRSLRGQDEGGDEQSEAAEVIGLIAPFGT